MPITEADATVVPERLETGRLVLRRHQPSDAEAIAALLDDLMVVRYLSAMPFPYRIEHARDWIRQKNKDWPAGLDYQFVVTEAGTGDLVGHGGLRMDEMRRVGELGYWFGRRYWGRGYASEAAEALVAFGFLDLKLERIWSAVHPANLASARVLVKAGLISDEFKTISFPAIEETVSSPTYALMRADYGKIGRDG